MYVGSLQVARMSGGIVGGKRQPVAMTSVEFTDRDLGEVIALLQSVLNTLEARHRATMGKSAPAPVEEEEDEDEDQPAEGDGTWLPPRRRS